MSALSLAGLDRACRALPGSEAVSLEHAILGAAFALVAPADDWRGPIDAVLPEACDFAPDLVARAVAYVTATDARVTVTASGVRVQALGYRAGPAGP